MSNELRWSHCDRLCRAGERYCPYCHEPIVSVAVSDGKLDDIPLEYWESFIDSNADKYLKVFKKHPDKTWFADFHLPAFLWSLEWMLYRKMYWQAAIVWAARVLLVFGMVLLFPVMPVFSIVAFFVLAVGMQVGFALFAHALYKQHCLRHLRRSLGSVTSGGTSVFGVIVFAVLANLLSTFLLQPLLTAMIYNLS